ncbi:hypothetical protein THIOM_001783 [Candidatus Thiomargarita nelsonii]|uniref:Uncharacterized protein n=1 Tax=Candidatus Thiomargarita nelsonii TaxID=1003181 RepID=A0A176S3C4_9GAMM|nr:hypothetical protein THIOM_001783 [Candidatus Thiomargarita nelsonii]
MVGNVFCPPTLPRYTRLLTSSSKKDKQVIQDGVTMFDSGNPLTDPIPPKSLAHRIKSVRIKRA